MLASYLPGDIPAVVVHVRQNGRFLFQQSAGYLHNSQQPVLPDTLFDLASLTKLFTTTAFLRLAAEGKVDIDTPVVAVLPEFVGKRPIQPYEDPLQPGEWVTICAEPGSVDAERVTFRHLLTHTSGLPAWRPLFRMAEHERRTAVLHSFFSCLPGTRVVYSDLGLILLGWAVEVLAERPLRLWTRRPLSVQALSAAIYHTVTTPLHLNSVRFGPVPPGSVAPTEFCRWRNRRMCGEVHDENAYALGGVAGHAGLFGTAGDVALLGQAWLDVLAGKSLFLPRALAETAVSLQAEDGHVRRGLGWALWSPDPESAGYPLSPRTFGHTGFTGTSLYVDPERELVIACMTNEVFNGRSDRRIGRFRRELHRAIVSA